MSSNKNASLETLAQGDIHHATQSSDSDPDLGSDTDPEIDHEFD